MPNTRSKINTHNIKILQHKPTKPQKFRNCFVKELGGHFRGSFWGRGELLPTPPILSKTSYKLLETWNLVRKHTHTYAVSENMPFSTKALLTLLVPAYFFFFRKSAIFGKNSTITQTTSVRARLEIF